MNRPARLAALFAVLILSRLHAETQPACPEQLAKAERLILVVSPGFDRVRAKVELFEKDAEGHWLAEGEAKPAVLGRNGLAWSWAYQEYAADREPIKTEGDRRTPAGFFLAGQPFGFSAGRADGYVRLAPGAHYCVDDPASPHYNTIVPKAKAGGASGEDMAATPIYRQGLFIDYPTNRAAKGGSCIFVHVWRGKEAGTSGCVALAEGDVEQLQHWSQAKKTLIGIIPEAARMRLRACLPAVEQKSSRKSDAN